MNPRAAINFLRSPSGMFLLFFAAILIGVAIVTKGFGEPQNLKKIAPKPVKKEKPQVIETVKNEIATFNPPKEAPKEKPPAPKPTQKKEKTVKKQETLPPISYYVSTAREEADASPSDQYAPYGRLVRCQLVVTVDSSSIQTPIIGLVTDPVRHNGQEIIPAGTEVHGRAQIDRQRERIASAGSWTLVWQDGKELTVSGLALDREQTGDQSWALTDGSAGLRGKLLKSDSLAEIKLFAATFLSGAADSLTDREQTIFGSRSVPSLDNAPFEGAQDVLNVYAQNILQSIQRDGFYVRVPAGKQFYLYVTETLDVENAVLGGADASPFLTPATPTINPTTALQQ